MNYTKGECKVQQKSKSQSLFLDRFTLSVQSDKLLIALCDRENWGCKKERLANAHLIAAAVNACASVNPDNPMAVAESIKDMYEATLIALDLVKAVLYEHPDDAVAQKQKDIIDKALTTAEGREK